MDLLYRRHDTQYDLLKKILGNLSEGIPFTPAPGQTLPVEEQGPNTVSQFVSAGLVDSFGRVRVSEPQTVLEAKHINGSDSSVWSDLVSGSATGVEDVSASRFLMSAPANSPGSAAHQTFRRAYYQAGKSQLIEVTFNITSLTNAGDKSAVEWRVGYGDATWGIFFGGNGNPVGLDDVWIKRRRQGGSDPSETVLRSEWNVDRLDGTGPSGKVLNILTPQIVWFDCEWLGVGQIRCGFIIDGERVLCHTLAWNNEVTTPFGPYLPSLSLPLRYSVTSSGAGAGATPFTLAAICGTVKSEGGQESIGRDLTIYRSVIAPLTVTPGSTWIPILGFRLAAATGARSIVRPVNIDVCPISGNNPMEFGLFRSPTLAGTAVTYSAWPGSAFLEAFVNNTGATTISAGEPLVIGTIVSTAQGRSAIQIPVNPENQLGLSAAGVPDTLILAVRAAGTGNVVAGSVGLRIAH
jgi:hypothetical protein